MDLKEFVAETLKQLIEGIRESQEVFKEKKGVVNPSVYSGDPRELMKYGLIQSHDGYVNMIEFDVGLTVTAGKGSKGGIGVFVGAIGLGSQGQSNSENTSASRIKFKVPIVLPRG